jgi:DNA-binding LacI/PurR family transcriptional regulator
MASGRDRLDGYVDALVEAGIEPDPELSEEGDFSERSGRDAMDDLLTRRPDIDAVFAASDLMAMGAMWTLGRRGRSIPRDVAVVGFDGTAGSETTDPPLTTVRQPLVQLGQEMAGMLLRHIEEPGPVAESLILPVELVVRSSA